jgi:hypothetical protein
LRCNAPPLERTGRLERPVSYAVPWMDCPPEAMMRDWRNALGIRTHEQIKDGS